MIVNSDTLQHKTIIVYLIDSNRIHHNRKPIYNIYIISKKAHIPLISCRSLTVLKAHHSVCKQVGWYNLHRPYNTGPVTDQF